MVFFCPCMKIRSTDCSTNQSIKLTCQAWKSVGVNITINNGGGLFSYFSFGVLGLRMMARSQGHAFPTMTSQHLCCKKGVWCASFGHLNSLTFCPQWLILYPQFMAQSFYKQRVSSESFQGSSGAQEVRAFPFLAAATGLFGINIEAWAALPATYTKSKDKDFTALPTLFHWQMVAHFKATPQQWAQ